MTPDKLVKSLCTCTCHLEEYQCDQCCNWDASQVERECATAIQYAVKQVIDGYNETLAIKEAYERGFRESVNLHIDKLCKEDLEAYKCGYNEGFQDAIKKAAKVAEEFPTKPGGCIHVTAVRMTEPYVTGEEWGYNIARSIRQLKP